MSDLFDEVVSANAVDRPTFRQAPEGNYLVTVASAKVVTAATGNKGIEITFTMQDMLDADTDMEGVTLSKCRLRDTLWITEKNLPYAQEKLGRIEPETIGKTFREALDILPGAETVAKVKHITEDRTGKTLNTPWLEVASYYSKDWYFANRLKAA